MSYVVGPSGCDDCPPLPTEVIYQGEYACIEVMSFEGIFTNGNYAKAQRSGKFVGMKKQ